VQLAGLDEANGARADAALRIAIAPPRAAEPDHAENIVGQQPRRWQKGDAAADPSRLRRFGAGAARCPFGKDDKHRCIALRAKQLAHVLGPRARGRSQDDERVMLINARRFDLSPEFDLGARALGQIDDAGIARRRLRQRMTAAVIAAADLRPQRDQRPERDEGDDTDRDDRRDQPRVEAMIGGGARFAHARAQFFATVRSA